MTEHKRILVVEDDFIMRTALITKIKNDFGENVFEATNGLEAIELLKTTEFDLVITNLHMPYYTGLEVIDFIRNSLKSTVYIIVLTKNSSSETQKDAYELGANDYLIKPIALNTISLKIKNALAARKENFAKIEIN